MSAKVNEVPRKVRDVVNVVYQVISLWVVWVGGWVGVGWVGGWVGG